MPPSVEPTCHRRRHRGCCRPVTARRDDPPARRRPDGAFQSAAEPPRPAVNEAETRLHAKSKCGDAVAIKRQMPSTSPSRRPRPSDRHRRRNIAGVENGISSATRGIAPVPSTAGARNPEVATSSQRGRETGSGENRPIASNNSRRVSH